MLDEIDLLIPPQVRLVILGQRGAGKTTFLNILSGTATPTRGWVERRAVVSAPLGLVRHALGPMTVRQLAHRLAKLYHADEMEIGYFVARFGSLEEYMDTPVRSLTTQLRGRLNHALFYGLPCDYYLFDGAFALRLKGMEARGREAFQQRRSASGMILATSSPSVARDFGGTGCILFRGRLVFFDTLKDSIAAFERLQIEHPVVAHDFPNTPGPVPED